MSANSIFSLLFFFWLIATAFLILTWTARRRLARQAAKQEAGTTQASGDESGTETFEADNELELDQSYDDESDSVHSAFSDSTQPDSAQSEIGVTDNDIVRLGELDEDIADTSDIGEGFAIVTPEGASGHLADAEGPMGVVGAGDVYFQSDEAGLESDHDASLDTDTDWDDASDDASLDTDTETDWDDASDDAPLDTDTDWDDADQDVSLDTDTDTDWDDASDDAEFEAVDQQRGELTDEELMGTVTADTIDLPADFFDQANATGLNTMDLPNTVELPADYVAAASKATAATNSNGSSSSSEVGDLIQGIELPYDLTPIPAAVDDHERHLIFLTTHSNAEEVGTRFADELLRLGYSFEPVGLDQATATRGDEVLSLKIVPEADTVQDGHNSRRYPAAGSGDVALELWVGSESAPPIKST